MLGLARIRGERAGSQPDDRHLARRGGRRQRRERLAERTGPVKVGERFVTTRRIQRLHAVQRGSVREPVKLAVRVLHDAMDAEERPLRVKKRLARVRQQSASDQQTRDAGGKSQRVAALREHDNRQDPESASTSAPSGAASLQQDRRHRHQPGDAGKGHQGVDDRATN